METKEIPLRWIKKPDRPDRLWFLAWPIVVKLGTTKENGMDTDHKLRIWLEWVRVVGDPDYESRCRVTTRDENGFVYYGNYFKTFKNIIHATKWSTFWISCGGAVIYLFLLISWATKG